MKRKTHQQKLTQKWHSFSRQRCSISYYKYTPHIQEDRGKQERRRNKSLKNKYQWAVGHQIILTYIYNQSPGVGEIFEEIKAKMFPNLMETINPQIKDINNMMAEIGCRP